MDEVNNSAKDRREALLEIMEDAAKGETKAALRAYISKIEKQLAVTNEAFQRLAVLFETQNRLDTSERPQWVLSALNISTLTSAGYRILGPGEWDPETVEKCAEVAAATDPEKPANWLHRREEIASATRALAKEKQGC